MILFSLFIFSHSVFFQGFVGYHRVITLVTHLSLVAGFFQLLIFFSGASHTKNIYLSGVCLFIFLLVFFLCLFVLCLLSFPVYPCTLFLWLVTVDFRVNSLLQILQETFTFLCVFLCCLNAFSVINLWHWSHSTVFCS